MSRSERLFELLQALRRQRCAVSAAALAGELRISVRTLYRDIASLRAQGARIDGEAGVGYALRPGFVMPPLMFSEDEIEALVLGMRWVADRGDPVLAAAARDALAKVTAVLPGERRHSAARSAVIAIPPAGALPVHRVDVAAIRRAIRERRKLRIDYLDGAGAASVRTFWPIALGVFDSVQLAVGWCELRARFRHFRTDRIAQLDVLDECYPVPHEVLMRQWRESEGLPDAR